MYNVLYMLRRLLFAVIAVVFEKSPVLQVQILIFHCILMIMYNILVKPFEEPKMNRLEIFNEVCILAAAYHLFLFTDYIESPEFRYMIGWSIISITTFNIVVNMLVMCEASL
jgi:hypothetical protein